MQASDRLNLSKYDTDKIKNRYLDYYEPFLAPYRNCEIVLLELGVHKGESLLLWQDYFPSAQIVGIDIQLPLGFGEHDRIRLYEGSQSDLTFLSSVASKVAPYGFDIIIDDASHIAHLTKRSFWHLFTRHLKPGGLYSIEDWGTGFWDRWSDGKSIDVDRLSVLKDSDRETLPDKIARKLRIKRAFPSCRHGMVGFVKQLVDEQGAADCTKTGPFDASRRGSRFEFITITPGIVFVKKPTR